MTSDAAKFRSWWTEHEAAEQISAKTGTTLTSAEVLRCALDRGVRFVVFVPNGTKARDGWRPIESGVWELITEGTFGEPGRHSIERAINFDISMDDVDGAWVERDGVRHQLAPPTFISAFPAGCTLGLRKQDAEDLAETLNKELAEEKPTPAAPKAERVPAAWKDVTITLTSEFQVQIHVGANPSHVQTYGDLGFENQQQNKPAKAWELFLKLAEAKPQRIDLPPKKDRKSWERETGDTERRQIQNRKDEINSALRTAFERLGYEIPTKPEPIQLNKRNDCYEPNFHIKLSSSYG